LPQAIVKEKAMDIWLIQESHGEPGESLVAKRRHGIGLKRCSHGGYELATEEPMQRLFSKSEQLAPAVRVRLAYISSDPEQ
jgi:hypothetical protein